MATIRKIVIHKCRRLEHFEINLAPANGRPAGSHLILTGPNGSGKTGLLVALDELLAGAAKKEPADGIEKAFERSGISLEWIGSDGTAPKLYLYFEAFRRMELDDVSGPKQLLVLSNPSRKPPRGTGPSVRLFQNDTKPHLSRVLTQFLVNKKTEQAFAQADGNLETVEAIREFFDTFQSRLRTIFGDSSLVLEFERERFDFAIRLGDGYRFNFRQLAHGHAAALHLVAELALRREWLRDEVGDRTFEPEGVVLIDELETHLHLELQEIILPFLCEMFPRLQFIVATHSPAVISSVDNAVVFDLRKRQPIRSGELQGIRYGTLMTSHFGLQAEFDSDTTRDLSELKSLRAKPSRSDQEQSRLRQLAESLAGKSHALALEVLIELERAGTQP